MRMTLAAAHGALAVVVEILEVIPGLRMVEFHKASTGDAADFYHYYATLLPLARALSPKPRPSRPATSALPGSNSQNPATTWWSSNGRGREGPLVILS